MKSLRRIQAVSTFAMLVMAVSLVAPRAAAAQSESPAPAEQRQRLETMQARGTAASLTILPVRLAGKPFDRLTEVVGLLLEQRGLANIELGEAVYTPGEAVELDALAAGVGAFVKSHPVATEYVLYAEFNGSRQRGLEELRAVVVDRAGSVVWTRRETPGEDSEARDPMAISVLLVEGLAPQFGLNEETARAARPGKMAARMDQRSGLPPQAERSALKERQQTLRQAGPRATLLVFAARVGSKSGDVAGAMELAGRIRDARLCAASPAEQPPVIKGPQPDPNEMKVLWDFAREAREHTRTHPPNIDYVLYADYVFNPDNWKQGYVHFVVCDRQGEWVIVDMQNSHHPDYQEVQPVSRTDCDRLLIKRLEHYLR